jgi:hypothetical protein
MVNDEEESEEIEDEGEEESEDELEKDFENVLVDDCKVYFLESNGSWWSNTFKTKESARSVADNFRK